MRPRAEASEQQILIVVNGAPMNERPDAPTADDPHAAQNEDPASGMSDDPRVDPTPNRRQSEAPADPTAS